MVFNRIAMSSFLRQPEHPIFYTQALMAHWVDAGARVLNGAETLAAPDERPDRVEEALPQRDIAADGAGATVASASSRTSASAS